MVTATGVVTGALLSYWSTDSRARVSTFGFTNTDPYDPAAYDQAGVYEYYGWTSEWLSARGSVTNDQAISICADLGTLAPGASQTFVYYTGLEASPACVISASAGIGGSISPSGEVTVFPGSSETFTITPSRGYAIAAVSVDGTSVGSVGTYTFANVTSDHTIHASFRPLDVMAPVIELPDGVPQGGVGSPFSLHLIVTDDRSIADVGVYENGVRIGGSTSGGDIRIPLTLADGRHDLVVVALDGNGQRTEKAVTLTVDTRGPVLDLDLPSSVTSAVLPVTGSVVDAASGLKSLAIDGTPVIPFLDGSFQEKLTLAKGVNTIVVEAVDNVGNTTSQTFTVTYASPSSSASSSIYVVLTIGSMEMNVNGMARPLDAAPVIKNGRTLLPIRALIETLGGKVAWDAKTRTATVTLGEHTVVLVVGKSMALVDGKSVAIDAMNSKVVPEIIGSRTFLPLRFIAENLGLDLAWEPISQTISFTYWP
jgi:hypothetical protein